VAARFPAGLPPEASTSCVVSSLHRDALHARLLAVSQLQASPHATIGCAGQGIHSWNRVLARGHCGAMEHNQWSQSLQRYKRAGALILQARHLHTLCAHSLARKIPPQHVRHVSACGDMTNNSTHLITSICRRGWGACLHGLEVGLACSILTHCACFPLERFGVVCVEAPDAAPSCPDAN
jgi:hypothetical protein